VIFKRAIMEADENSLGLQTILDLGKLFPAKTYEADTKLFQEYKGNRTELIKSERFLIELFDIPDIRGKLKALQYCYEAQVKLKDSKSNMEKVKDTFKVLKSDSLKQVLEICLAIGNYINNSKNVIVGFKFDSLIKLVDVKPAGSKTTLLHYIASLIENKYPNLLEWPEDVLNALKPPAPATGAIQSAQEDLKYLKNEYNILNKEISAIGENKQLLKLKHFLVQNVEIITPELKLLEEVDKSVEDDVAYFGESEIKDPATFFSKWEKFANAFKAAVKDNRAQPKKTF